MNNNTRKIVVLNKLNSQMIEQAIFILRDEVQGKESDALSEAQRIVDCYVKSLTSPSAKESKKKKPKLGFFLGMTLYTIATVIMTAYFISFS